MKKTLILLVLITLLGGFLRFYQISNNPPSLSGDEISFGYSAYSVLKTGHDEYGAFLPLTFKSIGDYKNPVPAYLMVPSIALFGLNEFGVRFPNAFIGTLEIPIFFFFLLDIFKKRKDQDKKRIALLGSFFMAISAWNIYYSRFAYEPLMASVFIMLGIWFLMKLFETRKIKWLFLSAFFLILTMYTAFAPRLFVPVFVFFAFIFQLFNIKKEPWKIKYILIFITCCVVFCIPLAFVTLFQGAGTRLSMVLINNDIEFSRYILLHSFHSVSDVPLLFFFWAKRFLDYLQPDFIFFNGLNMTIPGSFGLGMLYPFEIPWVIWGLFYSIKNKIANKGLFFIWLITGIFPDSLTNNQQHSGRLLQIAPILIMFTTLGAIQFFIWFRNLKNIYFKIILSSGYALFIVIILIHAYLTFAIHFPSDKGESFDEGLKQVALFVIAHQQEYDKIVIDPTRGVVGPYQVSNPYLYILFYSKYDPHTYQTEPKKYGSKDAPFYQFDKYEFRYINWPEDGKSKGTLFIGSPWSFPSDGIKNGDVLTTIKLTSGDTAFLIVRPK